MALNKQNIPISFGKGLDTKTDNKQVVPGKLLTLENAVLKKVGKFVKRFGYGVIANAQGIASGNAISTYKNELVAFDGNSVYSYSSSDDKLYNKGTKVALDFTTLSVTRNSYEQNNPDGSYHSNGISIYAWEDSSGGVRYSVFDVATNQTILTNVLINSNGSKPKVVTLGNYVIIFFLDGTTLKYLPISSSNPTITPSEVTVATGVANFYNVTINLSQVYVAYSTGTTTCIFTLSSALVQSGLLTVSAVSSCLGLFTDSSNNLWCVYNSTNDLKYFIYDSTLSTQVLAPTLIESGAASFVNITGIYNIADGIVLYEVTGDVPANQYVKFASISVTGTVITTYVFNRSVGIYSNLFKYNNYIYCILTHESDLQPTYFIFNSSGEVVGKLASSLGGGLSTNGIPANVSVIDSNSFLVAYEYKDFVQSVAGDVTTQTGINSVTLNFNEPILTEELGNNLHSSGAIISAYDSQNVNELGFSLYPETLDSEIYLNGGGLKQGNYLYTAIYEWTDSQGQIHKSAPSTPIEIDTTLAIKYISASISFGNITLTNPSDIAFINLGMKVTGPGITGSAYINSVSSPYTINQPTASGSGTYKFEPGTGFIGNSTIGSNIVLSNFNADYKKVACDTVAGSQIITLRDDTQLPINGFIQFVPTSGSAYFIPIISQNGREVTVGAIANYPTGAGFGTVPSETRTGIYLQYFKAIVAQNGSYYSNGFPTIYNLLTTQSVEVGDVFSIGTGTNPKTVVSKTSTTITFDNNFASNFTFTANNAYGTWYSYHLIDAAAGDFYNEYNSSGTNSFGSFNITKINNLYSIEVNKIAANTQLTSFFYSDSAVAAKITVPTLRVTDKQNAQISIYRTIVNGTVFYKVNTLNNILINDKTIDSIDFVDTLSDDTIIGNEQLYTTGGEVENISPPASNLIGSYKNRLLVRPNEDTLSFWYSKQIRSNTPIEFNDSFVQRVPEKGGDITAYQQMDDKLIIFKQDYIFVMVGDGPSVSGVNNDFTDPQLITADSGCSDKKSVVVLPTGTIYKSPKGFYLLDRALNVKYIGADVESYNNYYVTSAVMNETENQVRFTLSNGQCLVYDYYVEQWAVFPGISAVDAITFQDKYTYLISSGQLRKENTQFTDNGSFVPMVIETAWLNLAGILNYQRIYHIMLVGTYKTPHTLQIDLYRDFIDTPYETVTIPVLSAPTKYQYRIFPSIQKCEALKIKITELQTSPYGEGFDISAINLEMGIKRGQNKLSPDESYG